MHKNKYSGIPFIFLLLCLLPLIFNCQKKGLVLLAIDCKPGAQLLFTLDTRVNGTVFFSDSAFHSFSTSAACTINGRSSSMDSQLILVSAHGLSIASTILSPAEISNLIAQCQQTELPFALHEGQLREKPSESTPVIEIGAWNLFRTFATTLPVLPNVPIAVGFTWDRERHFPVETGQGSATAHLFQSFTFDSLVQHPQSLDAYLHWQFSYRIELAGADSSAVLRNMPQQGKGVGWAVLDVTRNKLTSANVLFSVPKSLADSLKISWKEEVAIRAVQ
jgi:hypothetical protein